eukprot:3706308-Rhodomonas_salina.3
MGHLKGGFANGAFETGHCYGCAHEAARADDRKVLPEAIDLVAADMAKSNAKTRVTGTNWREKRFISACIACHVGRQRAQLTFFFPRSSYGCHLVPGKARQYKKIQRGN